MSPEDAARYVKMAKDLGLRSFSMEDGGSKLSFYLLPRRQGRSAMQEAVAQTSAQVEVPDPDHPVDADCCACGHSLGVEHSSGVFPPQCLRGCSEQACLAAPPATKYPGEK